MDYRISDWVLYLRSRHNCGSIMGETHTSIAVLPLKPPERALRKPTIVLVHGALEDASSRH
jgi:hypothetical protein